MAQKFSISAGTPAGSRRTQAQCSTISSDTDKQEPNPEQQIHQSMGQIRDECHILHTISMLYRPYCIFWHIGPTSMTKISACVPCTFQKDGQQPCITISRAKVSSSTSIHEATISTIQTLHQERHLQTSDQDLIKMVAQCMVVLLPASWHLGVPIPWFYSLPPIRRQVWVALGHSTPEVESNAQVLICALLIINEDHFHDVKRMWANCGVAFSLVSEVGPVCQKCHPFP
jgi:hypothetical protein